MKISVITVSFNSEHTISDTIESVLNQTYNDIEYIIVDGSSSDNTMQIIKEYESKFEMSGKKLKWISEKDNGIYDAMNKGIKLSSGEVIGLLNSDDYYIDSLAVEDIAKSFYKEQCDCLYGNLKYINPDNNVITRDWVSREFEDGLFEKSWNPAHPTFYCKKLIYDKYGLYRTDFKISSDVELMYRFIQIHNISSYFLDRYLIIMRQGGVSNNGIKSLITRAKEMTIAFKDHGKKLNVFKYLFYKSLKVKELLVGRKK